MQCTKFGYEAPQSPNKQKFDYTIAVLKADFYTMQELPLTRRYRWINWTPFIGAN